MPPVASTGTHLRSLCINFNRIHEDTPKKKFNS